MNCLSSIRCTLPKILVGANQHTYAQYVLMTFVLNTQRYPSMSMVLHRKNPRHFLFSKHKNRFVHYIRRGGVTVWFFWMTDLLGWLAISKHNEYRWLFTQKEKTTGIPLIFKDILPVLTFFTYYYYSGSCNTENLLCHLFHLS